MAELHQYNAESVDLNDINAMREVKDFLEANGLSYKDTIEYTAVIRDPILGKIIATGSYEGSTLKAISVDPSKRGKGLSDKILTHLISCEVNRGLGHLFIYTNPKTLYQNNFRMFAGFSLVEETKDMALLEWGVDKIESYVSKLQKLKKPDISYDKGINSTIVMNCNPFTKGHLYLIETAAKESDIVYIFIVEENQSIFPTEIRFELVKNGVKHLPNVVVLKGGKYIISSNTFPTYFCKDYSNITDSQAKLDIAIFSKYIVPALKLNRRYVGTEPYCPVTNAYNEAMEEILSPNGVELVVIPRKDRDGKVISASTVRNLIRNDNLELIKKIVPEVTYNFITSERLEAKIITKRIKESSSRH